MQNIHSLSGTIATPLFILVTATVTAITTLGLDTTAQAQTLPLSSHTIFENANLTPPSFSPDPTTLRGISGGTMTANEVAGRAETATGACTGFVDEQPDHTLELSGVFNYLSLQIESPDDTTLIVRGPGGTWCNDDYITKNPGIAGQWLSGSYQVWVGSYKQDEYSPYVIRLTTKR